MRIKITHIFKKNQHVHIFLCHIILGFKSNHMKKKIVKIENKSKCDLRLILPDRVTYNQPE